jgi:AcrR family transcriptional regulator
MRHKKAKETKPPARKPTKRRRDERDARVDWILDEALDVAINEGLAALTTPRLAKRLDYTPAAFYRYFPSKDALIVALEARTAERFYALFFERLARARDALPPRRDPPARAALAEIALLVRTYADLAAAHPQHFRLVSVLVTGERSWIHGNAAEQLRNLVLPRVVEVIGYYQRAEDVGALAPGNAARRAMVMWLSVHAVLATKPLAAGHPQLLDLGAIRHEAVRSLLLGWGAKPKDVDAVLRHSEER